MALVEAFPRRRAGLAAARRRRHGRRAAICAIRPGSSGRCWRRRSRATSSPTSRSATSRSTAPIRGTISDAQVAVLESLLHEAARPNAAPTAGRRARWRNWRAQARRTRRARRLGRSLSIRQVDAGSCNGCELEIHALNNAFYDLERFGLRFVASPRHADVLLVTGPVTKNMREALERTYAPRPTRNGWWRSATARVDGGVFAGSYACVGGVSDGDAGRSAHPRLPAVAAGLARRAFGAFAERGVAARSIKLRHCRAANSECSPPPCGEGLGVGVVARRNLSIFSQLPPSLTLPHKGGGNRPRLPRVLTSNQRNSLLPGERVWLTTPCRRRPDAVGR